MSKYSKSLSIGIHPKSVTRFKWSGYSSISIESADRSVIIDPVESNKDSSYQYVFCTNNNYNHLRPCVIEKLAEAKEFRRIFLSRSCLYPSKDSTSKTLTYLTYPLWKIEQYVIFYPKYLDHSVRRGLEGDTAILAGSGRDLPDGLPHPVSQFDNSKTETPRPFAGLDEIIVDGWHVEGLEMIGNKVDVPFQVKGAIPQLGFILHDLISGVTYCHMGANQRAYDDLKNFTRNIDVLFINIVEKNPLEIKKTIQLIEPKCVVPIGFEDSTDHPFVNDLIKFCDSLPAKLVVPKLDEIYKVD